MRTIALLIVAASVAIAQQSAKFEIIPTRNSSGVPNAVGQLLFDDLTNPATATPKYVGFRAPNSITTTYMITLPNTPSGAGCVQDDGTGVWSVNPSCSSSVTGPPFPDNTAIIENNSDHTKLLKFSISGFPTGTTYTLTPKPFSYTLAGSDIDNHFSVLQTFAGTNSLTIDPSADEIQDVTGNAWLLGDNMHPFAGVFTTGFQINGLSANDLQGSGIAAELFPSTTNTWSLGDSTHYFNSAFITNLTAGSCTGCAPSNMVTTNTAQTISGQKSFNVVQTFAGTNSLTIDPSAAEIKDVTGNAWLLGDNTHPFAGFYTATMQVNGIGGADLDASGIAAELFPSTTNTWSLGDASHYFNSAYITNLTTTSCTGCAPSNMMTTNTAQTVTGQKSFSVVQTFAGTFPLTIDPSGHEIQDVTGNAWLLGDNTHPFSAIYTAAFQVNGPSSQNLNISGFSNLLYPAVNNTWSLGDASHYFNSAYITNLTTTSCTGCAPSNMMTTNTAQTVTGQKSFSVVQTFAGTFPLTIDPSGHEIQDVTGNAWLLGDNTHPFAGLYSGALQINGVSSQNLAASGFIRELYPATNNTWSLGDSTHYFNSAFIGTGTFSNGISVSGANVTVASPFGVVASGGGALFGATVTVNAAVTANIYDINGGFFGQDRTSGIVIPLGGGATCTLYFKGGILYSTIRNPGGTGC